MKYLIFAAILIVATTSQCNDASYVQNMGYSTGDQYCQSWDGNDNPLSTCDTTTGDCTDCETVVGYCDAEGTTFTQECIVYSFGSWCLPIGCNATMPCPSGSYCDDIEYCFYNCTVIDNCAYYGEVCNNRTGECEYIPTSASDSGIEDAFILGFLVSPEDFTCSLNNTGACAATGTYCNFQTNTCSVGCNEDADCVNWAAGTGLNKCIDNACTSDGTCTSSDGECASQLGFTCNTQTLQCEQPTGCTENADCTSPGVGKCDTDSGIGICVVETCEETADCVSSGYVCQNPPGLCIESCTTAGCNDVVNAALYCNQNTGLCEAGCSEDSDCTGNVNTCLEGICVITCETAQDCNDVGLPLSTCDGGSCVPDEEAASDSVCSTSDDCESGQTCQETPAGGKVCVDDVTGGGSCSKDSNCDDGYKCNTFASQCYPACDNDEDCQENFGGVPCESQKYGTGIASITIKYCDVSQTPLPTPQPTPDREDGVKSFGILGVMSVVMSFVAFM